MPGSASVNGDNSVVTVNSPRAIINWNGANNDFLPSANSATFTGAQDYIVLNRVTALNPAAPVQFNGTVNSNINGVTGGKVWFYSSSGILVGGAARFNVGSLLLSANNIGDADFLDDDNSFTFQSATANSKAGVVISPGAQIDARGQNSYVALIAPRVRQSGTVKTQGSAVYAAGEQIDMTISGSLFDISIPVGTSVSGNEAGANGTTADDAALIHDGTTTLETGYGYVTDRHAAIMVAVPKNDAVTMLVSGTIGYTQATFAQPIPGENRIILLAAGHNVDDSGIGTRAAATGSSELKINGGNYASQIYARTTGDAAVTTPGGLSVNGHLEIDASGAQPGDVNFTVGTGTSATVAGNLILRANAQAVEASGADATGGDIDVTVDGALVIGDFQQSSGFPYTGQLVLTADGSGGGGSRPGGAGGDGTGGNIGVLVSGSGELVTLDQVRMSADGSGGAGDSDVNGGPGGTGTGGDIAFTVDGGYADVGSIFMSAAGGGGSGGNSSSEQVQGDGAAGGDGIGGNLSVRLVGFSSDGGFARGGLDLEAEGYGGSGGYGINGGDGGFARGGNIDVTLGDTQFEMGSIYALATAEGGYGGGSGGSNPLGVSGHGGDGHGGIISLATLDAFVDVGVGSISLYASGEGGYSYEGIGGDGYGGGASLFVGAGSRIHGDNNVYIEIGGEGGAGHRGGLGIGGVASADEPLLGMQIRVDGELLIDNYVTLLNQGEGGEGDTDYSTSTPVPGVGGDGTGGNIDIDVNGTFVSDFSGEGGGIYISALGRGGLVYDSGYGESSGAGHGGFISMDVLGDLGAGFGGEGAALVLNAGGHGGFSYESGYGAGFGGRIDLNIGGRLVLQNSMILFADGGGDVFNPYYGNETGYRGGYGEGGQVNVTISGSVVNESDDTIALNISARGIGGAGGNLYSAPAGRTGRNGGDGVGGDVTLILGGSSQPLVDVDLNIRAAGIGGNGESYYYCYCDFAPFALTDANGGQADIGFGTLAAPANTGAGGDGQGGNVQIFANATFDGEPIVLNDLDVDVWGEGGRGASGANGNRPLAELDGGDGGIGRGGTIIITAQGGGDFRLIAPDLEAAGYGGDGGYGGETGYGARAGNGGAGGLGEGGSITLLAATDALLRVELDGLESINAAGTGGDGGVGGEAGYGTSVRFGGDGGVGGDGRGGTVSFATADGNLYLVGGLDLEGEYNDGDDYGSNDPEAPEQEERFFYDRYLADGIGGQGGAGGYNPNYEDEIGADNQTIRGGEYSGGAGGNGGNGYGGLLEINIQGGTVGAPGSNESANSLPDLTLRASGYGGDGGRTGGGESYRNLYRPGYGGDGVGGTIGITVADAATAGVGRFGSTELISSGFGGWTGDENHFVSSSYTGSAFLNDFAVAPNGGLSFLDLYVSVGGSPVGQFFKVNVQSEAGPIKVAGDAEFVVDGGVRFAGGGGLDAGGNVVVDAQYFSIGEFAVGLGPTKLTAGSDITINAGGTQLAISSVEAGGSVSFNSPVYVYGDANVEAGSKVVFASTVHGAKDFDNDNLTVSSGDGTLFGADVGVDPQLEGFPIGPLQSLTVNGPATLIGTTVITDGNQTYNGAVTLAAESGAYNFASNEAGNISFNNRLDGRYDVSVNTAGTSRFAGIVGGTSALNNLFTDGPGTTILSSSVTTTGTQQYDDAVVLAGNTVLNSNSGSGTIRFGRTLDGGFALTVNTAGLTYFVGAVGGVTPLASLTTNAGGTTAILGGSITTTGNQSYGDLLILGADTVLTGANSSFTGGVNGGGLLLTDRNDLTLNFSGTTAINGNFVNIGDLVSGNGGTTNLNGTITTAGTQTYRDAVVLAGNTVLVGTAGTFANGVTGNGRDLTLNFTSNTALNGTFAGIRNLATGNGGTTSFNGTITTTGTQTYNDAALLTGNTTLASTGSGAAGAITFGSTLNGARSLTVNTAGTTRFNGQVGATTALASLSTDAGGTTEIGGGSIRTTGNQRYGDLVVLAADTVLTGADGSFASGVNGQQHDLTLNFTGTTAINGNFVNIGDLVSGNGGTTRLSGTITTAGTQTYRDAVVLAGNTVLVGTAGTFANGVTGNGRNLTLDFTGNTALNGTFAGIRNLATGNGGTTTIAGQIATSGTQTYNDAVRLAGDAFLTSSGSGAAGNIRFASTVDGARNLEIGTQGAVTFGAAVGGATPLLSLAVSADAGITAGSVRVANDLSLDSLGAIRVGSAIAGDDIEAFGGDAVTFGSATATGLGDDTENGDGSNIRLNGSGAVRLDNGTAINLVELNSDSGSVSSAGLITARSLDVGAATNIALHDVDIQDDIVLTALGGTISGNNFESGGAIELTSASDINVLSLFAVDAIEATGGNLTLGTLNGRGITLDAAGSIQLTTARAAGDFLADAGGSFTADTITTVNGASPSTTGIRAAAIDPDGNGISVAAGGAITIRATNAVGGVRLESTGGAVQVTTDLVAGGPVDARGQSVNLNAINALSVRSATGTAGDVALGAGGNLTVQQASATGTLSATSGATLGLNGTIGGTQITLASRDIAIGSNAQVGSAAQTETLAITANGGSSPVLIGGSGGSGYSLDNGEFGRLAARDISINASDNGAIQLAALTIRGSGATNPNVGRNLTIGSGGAVNVIGAVAFGNTSAENGLAISSGSTLFVDIASGSIVMTDGGGTLGGTLELRGNSVIVATSGAASDVNSLQDVRLRDMRLATNDGAFNPDGVVRAGGIRLAAADRLYVQNTGGSTKNERAGITAGAGGFTLISTGSGPLEVIINARQLEGTTMIVGQALIPKLRFEGTNGDFRAAEGSTVNGCPIAGGPCGFTFISNNLTAAVSDLIDEIEGAGDSQPPDIIFSDLIRVEQTALSPIIDEPVTGSGNDELYTSFLDDDDDDDDGASEPVTGSGNEALVNQPSDADEQPVVDEEVTGSGNETLVDQTE